MDDSVACSCPRPAGRVLEAGFFARPANIVASELIGRILWRDGKGGGRLSEVEAYLPSGDPACHAAGGLTRRNRAMFGPPGTIYVFLSYGVHYLLNLVCEPEGVGSAVLVRSLAPLGGEAECGRPSGGICGPGRVGRSLGIGPSLDGRRLGGESGLMVIDDGFVAEVGVATRIGISRGAELPLRYYMLGNRPVTRGGRRRRECAR